MAEAIDNDAVNRRIYWHLDRALQRPVRHRCGEDSGRDERLADFGELMGTTVTENADVVKDNPAELDTYDRRGEPLNAVIHHPGHIEDERIVYENGVIANLFSAPPDLDAPLDRVEHFAQFNLIDYTSSVGLSCPPR